MKFDDPYPELKPQAPIDGYTILLWACGLVLIVTIGGGLFVWHNAQTTNNCRSKCYAKFNNEQKLGHCLAECK